MPLDESTRVALGKGSKLMRTKMRLCCASREGTAEDRLLSSSAAGS